MTAPLARHPPPTRRSPDRERSLAALVIIGQVGAFFAWVGWMTASFFGADCAPHAAACTLAGRFLLTGAGPLVVAAACGLAIAGMVRHDRRFAHAAWWTWGTYCAVWWCVLNTA